MDQKIVDQVLSHAHKGHTVMIGQSPTGKMKIKIKYGPFGMRTARYSPDVETYEVIRSQLKPQGH